LPNGNLLVSEPRKGRAFEVDPSGRIVWERINVVQDGLIGVLQEAQRVSPKFDAKFFAGRVASCGMRTARD
jgi:hypothetical protein